MGLQENSLIDMQRRLYMFAKSFAAEKGSSWTQSDWADLWGYLNNSQVSRIFNGWNKLPEKQIIKTCQKAGIDTDLFYTDDYDVLADLLGLTTPFPFPPDLKPASSKIVGRVAAGGRKGFALQDLTGSYLYAYAGRNEESGVERIVLERVQFDKGDNVNTLKVTQSKNIAADVQANGLCKFRSDILEMSLDYESDYPSSRFLFKPLQIGDMSRLFSGLYLDVSMLFGFQIFAADCHLFKVEDGTSYPHFLTLQDNGEEYVAWRNVFDDATINNKRLLGRSGGGIYGSLMKAVDLTRKREA